MAYGSTALSYGRRRKRPYISDLITAEASKLPSLYALKDIKERAEQEQSLQERGLTQTADIAKLGRESSERISAKQLQLDKSLAEATRKSQEQIASRTQGLEAARQSFEQKQAKTANLISGAGLGFQAYGLAKDAGVFGGAYSKPSLAIGAGVGAGTAYALRKKPKYAALGGLTAGLGAQAVSGGWGSSILNSIFGG